MIVVAGIPFFPYVLFTEGGHVLGLDSRSHAEVEAEWLAKVKVGAQREAAQTRVAIRAMVHNEMLAQRKAIRSEDPVLDPDGEGSAVSLDDVAPMPAQVLDGDEVLRLSGLPAPDGYGAVSLLACEVNGVARAWGDEADDLCAGVPTRVARGVKKGKKGRGR